MNVTAQNILEALRGMYENSGRSMGALWVIVGGASNALKLARNRLNVLAPGDRPQQLVYDVNRLLERVNVYRQELGFAGLSEPEPGAHERIARLMFTVYDDGPRDDSGLGWPGTTESYTPNSRPEAWKLGSILSQMATLDGIEHELNASAAWDQISTAMGEAAESIGEATGLTDAADWLGEQVDFGKKIALGAAAGIGAGLLLFAAYLLYKATK